MTLDITITDHFCGCGGSSEGARAAGATITLAMNHWKRAIESHNANFPNTKHVLTDLQIASPRCYPRTTGLLASPECTSHTLAKGQQRKGQAQPDLFDTGDPDPGWEAEERSRCTMWTPLDWAEHHKYEFVILENVVDAHLWGPFPAWLDAWRYLGYDHEIVYFNSMFAHPTPQSRDRMYFVAWRSGNRKPELRITPKAYCQRCEKDGESVQSWKNPANKKGKYKQQYVYRCPSCATEVVPYYYAAATAIDWALSTPRIGDRKKPLKQKTMQRIQYGLEKFSCDPFTVQVNKTTDRVRSLFFDTFPTQTGDNGLTMVVPFLLELTHPNVRATSVKQVFPTQTGYDDTALVLPFVAELHGTSKARSILEALATVCAGGQHHGLVVPPTWLMTYYQHGQMVPVTNPVPTVTTLARHALITGTEKEKIEVEDCGFRMLVPQEIQAAMAFPADYIVKGTRREQVKQLGNAVTAPVMKLLMERVIASLA